MKITKRQLRKIVREAIEKEMESNPFGTGMYQPAGDEDHPLIGHTWLTHGKIQDESLREHAGLKGNPIGKIIHHDLEKDGTINYYDLQINETTYRHIPARFVEAVSVKEHHHESRQ